MLGYTRFHVHVLFGGDGKAADLKRERVLQSQEPTGSLTTKSYIPACRVTSPISA